jgi:chemotaxis signal transduction protein
VKNEHQKEVVDHKVIIYPAMTSPVNGKRIYFLFSLFQVEDIQGELKVYDVPYSAPFVEGIAVWRESAIPVICLERYLGMKPAESKSGQRFIVIRSTLRSQEGAVEMRSGIRTEREIKMIPIPDTSELVKPNGWINHGLIKGVFEWEEGFIVVPETDKIFQGEISCNN